MNEARLDTFETLAAGRRSIRRYQERPVPPTLIRRLLAVAGRAPSAHNRQPWRWAVITGNARQRLADAMAADFRRDLLADGLPPEEVTARVERSRARIGGAPALILACMSMREMDVYPDRRRQACEHMMAVQSVALACQNLLLAAHAAGLGACWLCAPIFCPDTVRRVLRLPPDWEPQGLITLGWPADGGRDRPRKPLKEVTLWRR
ncbi:MAG: nitroreductase family protein [Ardenticatenia bacterium]|nr:nitroreductase family protein [Ardenticatenia bacterium]